MSGLQNDWRGGSLRRWKHILRISANASSAPSSKTDLSQPEAARRFVVGLRSVERYLHQWRTTGDLAARHSPGAPPAVAPRDYPALIAQLAADPDAQLTDHCAQWERAQGKKVRVATMQRLTQRVGWTRKKNAARQ